MTDPAYAPMPAPHPSGAPSTGAASRSSNPLGITSLIIGGAIYVLSFVLSIATTGLQLSGQYELFATISAVHSAVGGLLGLLAVGFGIAGLLKRGAGKAAAGAGTALGAVAALNVLNGLLITAVVGLA